MSNRLRARHTSTRLFKRLKEPLPYERHFFYKYRTVERFDWLEEILLGDTLYFPTAAQLHDLDPKEARPLLDAPSRRTLIKRLVKLNRREGVTASPFEIATELGRRTKDELLRDMTIRFHRHTEQFRIYSVGSNLNCEHLWKEYAGNHTGYCLEFQNDLSSWKAYHVRYEDVVIDVSRPVDSNFFFYKNKQWSKEEEIRLFDMRDSACSRIFHPILLKRVILGRKLQPSDAAKIREMVGRRKLQLSVASEDDL